MAIPKQASATIASHSSPLGPPSPPMPGLIIIPSLLASMSALKQLHYLLGACFRSRHCAKGPLNT